MSRNVIQTRTRTGLLVEVVAGWDRPLSRLYCSSVPLDEPAMEHELSADAEDELYQLSVMAVQDWGSAQDICNALAAVGILLPTAMVEAIEHDERTFAGNTQRLFDHDGLVSQVG